jgi:DNA primase
MLDIKINNQKLQNDLDGTIPLNQKNIKSDFPLSIDEDYIYEERLSIQLESKVDYKDAQKIALGSAMAYREEIQSIIYSYLESLCNGIDDRVKEYLTGNQRKLTLETIKRFRIFSIKDVNKIIEGLKRKFTEEELKFSGLFNEKGNFMYLYNRIIIPYLEEDKIVYLRGRYFYNGKYDTDKYKYLGLYNAYAKTLSAKRFYNIDVLRSPNDSRLVICEGEFDTMIACQNNATAIGIGGVGNIPEEKIQLLDNFEIYIAFDNDAAGQEATNKIAKILNRPIKVIRLKNHKDISEVL